MSLQLIFKIIKSAIRSMITFTDKEFYLKDLIKSILISFNQSMVFNHQGTIEY